MEEGHKPYRSSKERRAQQRARLSILGPLPETVREPADNLGDSAKVKLGKLLFFDPILSGNRDVACATCHHPSNGYAEFRDLSIGVNGVGLGSRRAFRQPNAIPLVKRNAHTILNTAFNGMDTWRRYDPETAPMFWDNRTQSLEKQALEPMKALEEMRGTDYDETTILTEVVRRLRANADYRTLFSQAFSEPKPITADHIGKAIAAFERTLVTTDTRFDRYLRGDPSALSLAEREGFEVFKQVGCANCHNGPMLSDYQPHVIGVPPNRKLPELDKGFDEQFAFRTASLRNLRFTAPYMHNGQLKTLQEVLEFYEDVSVGKVRDPAVSPDQYDPLLRDLTLRVRDMGPIISFLNTLNATDFDQSVPATVPSGLPVGGAIQ